ncbi:TonB-dependent receptor [Hymenobacter negativus]|uniref:TonB-dependent receptor n=1 Tax=Hymenobacter negativus TaxID=2795026 RepID=A0ABS3QPK7_9BACT|nr:TonB-dependent receptor [Hymenobacter negativus]MBO2012863.1 TonB-dependent receptor [Hymenobacter negativus]
MRILLLGFFLLFMNGLAFGQQGKLAGKVTDKKTNEGVIGATVLVTGTTQAAPVNVDGSYELPLDAGTYNITVTYVGYKPLTFPGIVIKSGETTTLNGQMEESATSLTEVTVTGVKQTGTEVALIQDLRRSEVVVSGMSNDQIVKTLDRDAAEVVKRIPGVTIQNNNFIVIRGLAERYNTVMLNDALTPSAETDTRSFSFDILPSSVIDRVLIFKSGAPELPGEFGGGVVKVYTKNSVLENSTSLSVSGWARNTNTFKGGFQSTDHSSTDFLGFDNGQREMPGLLSDLKPTGTTSSQELTTGRTSLRNEFLPRIITSRPDLRFSLGINRKFEIGKVYVSNVTSISYSNTQEQYTSERQRYDFYDPKFPDLMPLPQFRYQDTRSLSAVRLGVIHNYQVRLNDRNRLEFRNFFNQYGTDEVVNRRGPNYSELPDIGLEHNDYSLHYQSRSIYSGQLGGTHEVGPANRTALTWAVGYNYVSRSEPDYRQNQQTRLYDASKPGDLNPAPFEVQVNNIPQTSARFFANLKENTYMASGQAERRFAGRDTLSANLYKLRAGFYTEQKSRDYDSRFFNYARAGRLDPAIASQPLSTIFSPENLNTANGFVLRDNTNEFDRYTGQNTLLAGYISGVAPLSEKFNLSGGVRVEYNRKFLESGAAEKPYEEKRTFLLPSLNATYNFNERHLLRAGGSISVNRPEFREVAKYNYFDFNNNFNITGNETLRTAKIYNADLRYEFYPTRSEMISVGVFYKHFTDAIEQVTDPTTGSDLYLTFQNAPKAYDLGVEVEARKSLVGLTDNAFLQHFSLILNASLIKSRVQLDETLESNTNFAITDRALQGQSPYVVNAGLFYQDDERHWQISAQYNVIGPRISFVGDKQNNPSIIELQRHVVDLALTKGFGNHLEVRAGVQNLLNQLVRQNYDFDRNGEINGIERDASFNRYRRGTYSTLGLTYRF